MKDKVLHWLGNGHVGMSSKAMAFAAAGIKSDGSYPLDPDDLNRCILLLRDIPEIRQHMDKVSALNKTWAKLVEHWEEMEMCFLNEAGLCWSKAKSAPKTYKLMQSIIYQQKEGK